MPNTEKVQQLLASFYQTDGEPSSFARRLFLTLTHPLMTLAAIRYILEVPIVNVSIPEEAKSRAHWLYDPSRPWRLRGFISSYIELPTPVHEYWHGQAKQNLRKSTARAKNAGFKARAVDKVEIVTVIAEVFEDKGWKAEEIAVMQRHLRESLEGGVFVAVFNEEGRALAFCTGVQSGDVVRSFWANTSLRGQVRWLCFSTFVEEVSARGARFIVESPPWAMPEGNRMFAGRLGFRPARIRGAKAIIKNQG